MKRLVVLLGLVLLAPMARAEVASLEEVTDRVIDQVLSPVLAAAEDQGSRKISLREVAGPVRSHNLADVVAGYFFDRGFDVFELTDTDEAPADGLLLEYTVHEVGVAFPHKRRGFLGIRGMKTSRSVRLGLRAELTDAATGRWIWRGAPRARVEDWVDARELVDREHPLFGPAAAGQPAADADGGSDSLWERSVVAGLLGGILLLYFSGVS